MRILYYSTAYSAKHGGSNHSKAFVKFAGQHPLISAVEVYPDKSNDPMMPSSSGVSKVISRVLQIPILLPLRFYKRNLHNLEGLFNKIELYKPDVVVVRLDNNFLQLNKIRKKFPTLILVTEVNASPFDESFKSIFPKFYYKQKEKSSLAKADFNFFVSSFLKQRIMGEAVKQNRDLVNHNGFDDSYFYPVKDKSIYKEKLNVPAKHSIIGYVGTIDDHKRLDLFVDAFGKVQSIFPDVYAIIVGGGAGLSKIISYVESKGLSNNFLFTGQVEHHEVHTYLKAFDIAIHHAANDYMSPLKLFEYLAVNIPVVGPDIPAVREVFKNKEHLLLTKPEVENIAANITYLLQNPDFTNKLAINGCEYVHKNFKWENNVNFVIDTINKVIPIENTTTHTKASIKRS